MKLRNKMVALVLVLLLFTFSSAIGNVSDEVDIFMDQEELIEIDVSETKETAVLDLSDESQTQVVSTQDTPSQENEATPDNEDVDNNSPVISDPPVETSNQSAHNDTVDQAVIEPPTISLPVELPPNETHLVHENSTDAPIAEPSMWETTLTLLLDTLNAFVGDIINVQTILTYDNDTPIPDKRIDFYADGYLGSKVTNVEGVAEFTWDTSSLLPGPYTLVANYSGDEEYEPTSSSVDVIVDEQEQNQAHDNVSAVIPKNKFVVRNEQRNSVEIDLKHEGSFMEEFENSTYNLTMLPQRHSVSKIEFTNLRFDEDEELGLSLPNLDGTTELEFKDVFAIDPERLDFESALVTSTAQDETLYKCKDWDFVNSQCLGPWKKLMDLTVGEEYSFNLTPHDPGFAEGRNRALNITSNLNHKFMVENVQGTALDLELRKNGDVIQIIEQGIQNLTVSPGNHSILRMDFVNLDVKEDLQLGLSLPEPFSHGDLRFKHLYGIDYRNLQFEGVTIRAVAHAPMLYSCKDWDFENSQCLGKWEELMELTVGEEYSFTLNQNSPGLAEGNRRIDLSDQEFKIVQVDDNRVEYRNPADPSQFISIETDKEHYRCLHNCPVKVAVTNTWFNIGEQDFEIKLNNSKLFRTEKISPDTILDVLPNKNKELIYSLEDIPIDSGQFKFDVVLNLAGHSFILDPTAIPGCIENSTTQILECTGSITGSYIDVDNASIYIHDAVIDATSGSFFRLNTTLDYNITLDNVTVNANGGSGSSGANNPSGPCINFDQQKLGGNGNPGGSSTSWFTSYTYIYDSTINSYGGNGGAGGSAAWTEGSSGGCDATGGRGANGGSGNITGFFVEVVDSTFNSYGGNGGAGGSTTNTESDCANACGSHAGNDAGSHNGGQGIFINRYQAVEPQNWRDITINAYSGNGGAAGSCTGGSPEWVTSAAGSGASSVFEVFDSELNILSGAIDADAGSAGGGGAGCGLYSAGGNGDTDVYFESDFQLTFDDTSVQTDGIINLTNDTVDRIGFFNTTDVTATTYVYCTAPEIIIGNESSLDVDLDWTNCPAYQDGNITWVDYENFFYVVLHPSNVLIDSGADGGWDYNFPAILNETTSPQEVDLNYTAINEFLESCTADAHGNCQVPIVFNSQTAGQLEYSNINITYFTYAEENFSRIRNDDVLNASVHLLMSVDFYSTEVDDWLTDTEIFNDVSSKLVQPGNAEEIDLSLYWTNWNTSTSLYGTGLYRAYAAATDENDVILQNRNGSSIFAEYNFTIDVANVAPVVTLESPEDSHESGSSIVNFNCSARDDNELVNITLYGNWSGGWHANETKPLMGKSNSTIFTKTLPGGVYEWNCLAFDNNSLEDWGDVNYNLVVEPTAAFTVKDGSGNNAAIFYGDGGITLAGDCNVEAACSPPADSYVVRDSVGNVVSYVNPSGDLCIESGDCSDLSESCNAPADSFIVHDDTGNTVSYIDPTGDLCLTGILTENGNP